MKEKKSQGQSNILVAIRVRPINLKQANSGDWNIIRSQDNLIIILDPIEKEFQLQNKKMLDVLHRSKEQRYAFDKIYRNQNSQIIYQQTVKSLIKTVLEGKNATVFAYGPTGTGKTYTMLGNQQIYGLNVLAIRDIFNLIEEDLQFQYSVYITYVEIYNQMIRDLLIPTSGYLQLRDDGDKGVTIAGVTQFKAESTQQVMNLLLIGNKRRTTQATNANQTSSRSHAVFQISVSKVSRTKNTSVQTLCGKLSLIDLAGSQRGTVTENRGIRLMEGAKINRSLLALANCINALGDKNKKGFFVPYRDSKLTRLLKDSLGGNCKTVMIVNISPASSQFQQTINTLKYANRAKNIKTKALTNKKLVSIHISEYKNIINDLRQQIEQLRIKLQKSSVNQNIALSDNESQGNIPLNVQSSSSKKQNQICICGKAEQKQQIRKIKQQIFQNFNQRIQFRRALMEIQQQNALNILQIRKKQSDIIMLKKEDQNQNMQTIKSIYKTIHTLKLSTQKNMLKKQITNLQLIDSMTMTKKIRQQIPRRIKSKQNRDFLQIVIKNHVLQLQNIQLEINLQIQQKIINDLKNISDSQKKLIQQKGITLKTDEQILQTQDIELQIEDDEDVQGDIVQIQENYDDDFEQQEKVDYINQQKVINQRISYKKKSNKALQLKIQDIDDQQKNKRKQQHSQNNILSVGIIGSSNIKKRQHTVTDNKTPPIIQSIKHSNNSDRQPTINKDSSNDNLLDFNLKGVNLRLNQKVPFSVLPKQKKKK